MIKNTLKGMLASLVLAGAVSCSQNLESRVRLESEEGNKIEDSNLAYATYVADNEGRKKKVYDPIPDDGKDEPTIGVGHYLDRGDSRETFKRVLPEVNYDDVYNKRRELEDEEIDKLLSEDIKIYVKRAKNRIPKFDEFPLYVRQAIVDGFYRGDLSGSPKTLRYINDGEFGEASKEYLNHNEYVNAAKLGRRGIRKRMENNAAKFLKYHKEKK